ncbi:caspase-1-like isoform X1 [Schistocerca gregaria]|uniref:caspase-1-like isoform X1 n=2 Tax=Schistocerca gregaria TaxID=7010 RepID=UPI00211E8C00|nr:caspase-1-like isoform X1 [Schistocerca gregaria]
MDRCGSNGRGVMDEVDIARQPNQNIASDSVDARPDGNASGRRTQAESIPTSSIVLPNPGVSRDAEEYFMGNRERGVALIISHEKFDVRQYADGNYRPKDRLGTKVDRDALRDMFTSLGFRVLCFDDLCHYQIRDELRRVADQNHSNRDCVAVAVLTHGERNGQLDARDREYNVSELWQPFTARLCPTLAGKPKLFFIQACKGTDTDAGVMVSDLTTDAPDSGYAEEVTYPVPSYADIIVSYSTFEGLYSFRNPTKGSWYVETLCSQLETHGRSKDLVSVLTDVNRIVGQRYRSENKSLPQLHGKVQAPCFTSSLTRSLCFGHRGHGHPQCSSHDVYRKKPRSTHINAENIS